MRRLRPAPLAAILMLLPGCSAPRTAPPALPHFRAALVLDTGGRDDQSFNAAAVAGLEAASAKLKMAPADIKFLESYDPGDFRPNLTAFADQGYDVVIAVGYLMEDALKEVAPLYPKVKFAIVDGSAPNLPNCSALKFREEEGSFLAGYVAGGVSKTHTIGFIGGKDIPLINRFLAGYTAGAKTAFAGTRVTAAYTGDWNDLNKGRTQADQIFANGADIIFAAAGKGGNGVIASAKDHGAGHWAIGVDRDQDALAPGRVLTSMMKRVDVAVEDTIERTKAGRFLPGAHVYGLKEKGVGLSPMQYTRHDVPTAILARLPTITQQIESGVIHPPATPEAARAFQPPALPR